MFMGIASTMILEHVEYIAEWMEKHGYFEFRRQLLKKLQENDLLAGGAGVRPLTEDILESYGTSGKCRRRVTWCTIWKSMATTASGSRLSRSYWR